MAKLLDFILDELGSFRPYFLCKLNSYSGSETLKRIKKLYSNEFYFNTIPTGWLQYMLDVPIYLEKLIFTQISLCCDSIIYDLTFMPVQVCKLL